MNYSIEMTCIFHNNWIPIELILCKDDYSDRYLWHIPKMYGHHRIKKLLIFGEIRYLDSGANIKFDELDFKYITQYCVGMQDD